MLHAEGLKGLIIFLVVAGVIVPLFHRARIGTVLGFLIAGVVLGPHGLGQLDNRWLNYITFDNPEQGEVLAEFGIVVLLFLLGLELSLQRLWQLRLYVLGVGLLQVLLSTFAIGGAIRLIGGAQPAAIVLGLCLALSSTAIVMQLLIEQHRAANQVGRIALSVLLFQDLMVVPILFVVGIMSGTKDAGGAGILQLIQPFAEALAAVIVIMFVGRYVVRPLLRSALRTGSRDLIMAITLLILVGFSLGTGLAGLSVALGAFLAGLLLSDSEVRHNIEVDLEPFKGLLLGIFFITVGTRVNLGVLAADVGWIVLAVVALMGVKAAILYAAARLFRVPRPDAAEVALLLAQAGEFGFVVIAVAGPLLSERLAAGAVAVVGLSMLATPVLAVAGRRLAARLAAGEHGEQAPGPGLDELKNHVIIGGFGRVGRLIASALEAENVPYVGLETNGELVARMRLEHKPVFFGDAGRPELLEKVGASRARAFVVTLNNPLAAERMVSAALNLQSKPMIFARAADPAHAMRLLDCGAVSVIPETVEAGLQMAARLLEGLDLPDEVVTGRVAKMRAAELGRLVKEAQEDRGPEPSSEDSGDDENADKVP